MIGLVMMITLFVGIVAVGFSALSYYHETQRIEQMRFVGERLGFSFWPEADLDLQERLGPFYLSSQGHSRKIQNVFRMEIHDIAVTLFEYRYRTNQGKHTRTHRQTVLLFETERLQLPLFTLRPEGMFHRIAKRFGYQDINFEAHPVFSESYLLRGHEEAEIRRLFSEQVLNYYSRHDELCTEGDGQRLIFYQKGQTVEPGWLEGFLEQGLDVLDLFMKRESALGAVPFLGLDFEVEGTGTAEPVFEGLPEGMVQPTPKPVGGAGTGGVVEPAPEFVGGPEAEENVDEVLKQLEVEW
jgi:hypothetical protein